VHRRVARVSVLLDGVALLGLDGDLAFLLNFSGFAAWLATAPVPGDCCRESATSTLEHIERPSFWQ
jgi:hypothetical protein